MKISGIIHPENEITELWPQGLWQASVMDGANIVMVGINPSRYIVIDNVDSHLKYPNQIATLPQWIWHTIQDQHPDITIETSGLFTPNMLQYDLHGIVDFAKGCYLGQEIIARTHHLGRTKKKVTKLMHTSEQFPIGSDCTNTGGDPVGTILLSAQKQSLAVISESELANPIYVTENGSFTLVKVTG